MSIGTEERPLRVAVVGSGPSGFYAAEALFKAEPVADVDMFERLPVPFGLVRFGVAPDHPKIKSVTRIYERTATNERFTYYGNVDVGSTITVDELREHYDAVIFAVGASSDRSLGIPGEDMAGSRTATEFVAWYNGHPDYRDYDFDLSGESAVIIGQGNVAVDVARILAKTVDELKETDIAQHALDALAKSNIKDIYLVGRRGPAQAAFTLAEIKEMGHLAECDVRVAAADMELSPASLAELEEDAGKRKNVDVLKEFSTREPSGKPKRMHILFFQSPTEIRGTERVESIVLETNELTGEAGKQKSSGTGKTQELATDLVFRSVGYRGVEMAGVPFHEAWGVFPNNAGRITEGDAQVPGMYVTGWIKRGPSGVVGTNKQDSVETVQSLLEDLDSLPKTSAGDDAVRSLLKERGVTSVSFADWQKIDAAEVAAGQAIGKPREKFVSVQDMLNAVK